MKVFFTCNRVGTGGAERVICNLSNRMAKDGNEIKIVCLDVFKDFYYPLEKNVHLHELDKNYSTRIGFWDRKLNGIRNFKRLFQLLKKERPDVVITFYTRQSCYSILACRMLKIPVIAAERDHFFVNDSKVNRIMRRCLYPKANGFIHQTEWARNYLRENCHITCEDIVLPNPLWIKEFPERSPESGRVIAVGRLAEQKNYDKLIDAFDIVHKRIPGASLHIYGEGEQREQLTHKIQNLGLEKTIFLEGISHDVVECYKKAEVFVLYSKGEGYPNVLMEALSVGVPCVSVDCIVGGPADMIKDGYNGFLVPPDNADVFADKVCKLLEDANLRAQFEKNAKFIRETNDFEKIYKDFFEYVQKVMVASR